MVCPTKQASDWTNQPLSDSLKSDGSRNHGWQPFFNFPALSAWQMQCLVELILTFLLVPNYYSVPMLTMFAYVLWLMKASRPCFMCLAAFYLLLVVSVMSPVEQIPPSDYWFDRSSCAKGIFDCLRISPEVVELNLLLRLWYNFSGGLWRSQVTDSPVWAPVEGTLNYVQALLQYLLTPQYGPIERV